MSILGVCYTKQVKKLYTRFLQETKVGLWYRKLRARQKKGGKFA